MQTKVWLPEVIGSGYGSFFRFKGRYVVVKGSRASKKSTTAAMKMIHNIMAYPDSNGLVVRKVFRTLKDSCFAQLRWAIRRLKVDKYWQITHSPMELTYKPTGQKIYFRGLDDPLKVASITVDQGYLCFMWLEEAYEVLTEADFDVLDESIRGAVPEPLFKQIMITFNPWNEKHWLKKRFFDVEDPDILALTTDYRCNEFLDDADRRMFESMKERNPRRYQVAGLGNWGIVDGLVYENWREEAFNIGEILKIKDIDSVFGLDYGYVNDPSALFCGLADERNKRLYVFDEIYEKGLSNEALAKRITEEGYNKEIITAENEPKSNDRLRFLGISRIRTAVKGPDSIVAGVDFLQDWEIIIHPRCVNFITEISNYQFDKDKFGKTLNKPIDDFNHLMDAMRYAMERLSRPSRVGF